MDDDQDFGEGLPPEEDYVEESELEEENTDFGPPVSEDSDEEDDDEEKLEDEEDDDDAEEEYVEFEAEPYPDEENKPWELEDVKNHFYNLALYAVLKEQGIDTSKPAEVNKAVNAAYQADYTAMKAFDERLKKDAEKEAEKYKKNVYEPWHEQYNNAQIAEEFGEVLNHFPEYFEYREEIQLIGPEFFKDNPKLANSPAKALPILIKIVKELGKMPRNRTQSKEKPSFAIEKGRRSRPAPKSNERSSLLSETISNPGDWIQRI